MDDLALLQAARDAAARLYGQAYDNTKAQQAAIEQSYANAAASMPANASARNSGDAAETKRRSDELSRYLTATGARRPGGSAAERETADQAQNAATAGELWRTYFNAAKGTAVSANQSQADAFISARDLKQEEFDRSIASALAAAAGGGGGGYGGGGGNYWEDEPAWEEPETSAMTPELIRGAAASQRRYEGQADYFNRTGRSSNTGTRGRRLGGRRTSGGSF